MQRVKYLRAACFQEEDKSNMETTRAAISRTGLRSIIVSILAPRIWKLMIACAYPYLLLSWDYFEILERTGRLGAYIAYAFLPASLVGYIALIFMFKKSSL
jgi:hypothetical protein